MFTNGENGRIEHFRFEKLGIDKLLEWEYENEFRFRVIPIKMLAGNERIFDKLDTVPLNLSEKLYIPLKNEIEEIMMGPYMSKEEETKLRSFLKRVGFKGKITKSIIESAFCEI